METTQIVKELLARMGLAEAEVSVRDFEGRTKIDIKIAQGRDLIGENGVMLACFQHIVKKIITKRTGAMAVLDIDVNGYKKMRESILRDFAKEMREKVCLSGRAVEFKPMHPADRRVIHIALAEFSDVITESMGEGQNRYVVVRPYP